MRTLLKDRVVEFYIMPIKKSQEILKFPSKIFFCAFHVLQVLVY